MRWWLHGVRAHERANVLRGADLLVHYQIGYIIFLRILQRELRRLWLYVQRELCTWFREFVGGRVRYLLQLLQYCDG
jgi:hypothetical protein